ncbi:hypothetical protein KFU94_03610 [Chloroflexi bacterium TSY]|nr:hypothetical protein [Chloroflexi bacterium TSY]
MPLLKLAEHYFYILSRFFRVDSFFRPFRFALCHSSLYQKVKLISILTIVVLLVTIVPYSAVASQPVVLIVQLTSGVEAVQFGWDHDMTLLDSIDSLGVYRYQGTGAQSFNDLTQDARTLSVEIETQLSTFEAQKTTYGASTNDAEALRRYFGSGSGDGEDNGNGDRGGSELGLHFCKEKRGWFILAG